MSITLNHSDFQCLQDQLVDLKTKNYELVEKNRRSQADFEAAKAKICSLQLKLEEQERDFQVTSTTLRREIEAAYNSNNAINDASNNQADDKVKYKKLLHKAKELQQRYDKSLEVVQQMDSEIKTLNQIVQQKDVEIKALNERIQLVEEESEMLKHHLEDKDKLFNDQEEEHIRKLNSALEECKFTALEERRIQDKKGLQIVKELKRQLTLEKNKRETLEKRLEKLLTNGDAGDQSQTTTSADIENRADLSAATSSSSNSAATNGNGSWSLVPANVGDKISKSNLSICSIDLSDDRETIHHGAVAAKVANADTKSDSGSNQLSSNERSNSAGSTSLPSPMKQMLVQQRRDSSQTHVSNYSSEYSQSATVPVDEQMALMERLTRLQHDKWTLEEKMSYLEQANAALSEELANKSDIIKHYFLNQALKQSQTNQQNNDPPPFLVATEAASRRISLVPSNINQLLTDRSSLKKVVDFLKERSQQIASSGESESITREATRKMQLMLEETLIKCLKLQENLDFVTSELNKIKK